MAERAAGTPNGAGNNAENAPAESLDALIAAGDQAFLPPSSGALEDIPMVPPSPFWVRWKLLPLGATAMTVTWFWFSYVFVEANLGWNNLAALLPH